MQAGYATKLLWITVYYAPVTSVSILKCNTLYMSCWQILHQAQHNQCHPQQRRIPILRGLKFIIFSSASSRIHWSDSSWSRLKHLLSYKIPCATNEHGMRGGHQSPAYKPSFLLIFRRERYNVTCTSEKWKYERRIYGLWKVLSETSEWKVNWRGWYVGQEPDQDTL